MTKTANFNSNWNWQQHHRCHFSSFLMYISGTKFEEHCLNIPRDILDSVFYHFSCSVYNVITFLICIMQKRGMNAPFFCILKSLSKKQQLFFISWAR